MGRIRAMLLWCALIQLFSFLSLVYGKPEVESSGGYYDDEDIMLRKGISCPPSVTCPAGQVCLMYKYPHCHVPEATPPPPNNCLNNPCGTGGSCVSMTAGYRCDCKFGYTGRNCEIKVKTNNCENHQCSLGSTCVALSVGYRCDCSPGYTGTYCSTNNCANNQCVFGTCVALSVGYRCECRAGYSGTYCNTRINNCDNNQCTSGSTCVALTSGYRCNCSPGYTGTYCSTNNCANN
uniref:EGF-like domain-containing protein n=1 Tax=Ciona savignyi TaxID=51511 RepID=H2Z911_CIOSA